jgi:hypothetical protein
MLVTQLGKVSSAIRTVVPQPDLDVPTIAITRRYFSVNL